MPLVNERHAGLILVGLFCTVLVALVTTLVVHFVMPNKLVERYWKEPHFGPFHLGAFTGTVWAPVRTVMLLAAIAFPAIARKRGMTDVQEVAPAWCRWIARLLGVVSIVSGTGLLLLTVILLVHFQAVGAIVLWPSQEGEEVDWDLSAAIGVLLAGAVLLVLRQAFNRPRGQRWRRRRSGRASSTGGHQRGHRAPHD